MGGKIVTYHKPDNLIQALEILHASPKNTSLYAGGTDLMPRWNKGRLSRPDHVLDLKGISELREVESEGGEIGLGACMTVRDIMTHPTVRRAAPVLARAAGRIACSQIRNRATVGGNLCNASPAADTAIPLILLDARVELKTLDGSGNGRREVAIHDFFQGPGATVLEPGELMTRIRFRPFGSGWFSGWDKFGTRPSMEIAVASVGVALHMEKGTVREARVGYGSVAPVPLRGAQAEKQLEGNVLSEEVIDACVAGAREEISPITDVRASADYRRHVVGVMLRRLLEGAKRA
jgi:CO/xanthine dehydrogenase FAD-binding subunit